MTEVKLPFIRWRDGKPRFHPSGRELALGFKGEDLRHPGGAWFTFEQAAAWSRERYAAIVEARAAGPRKAAPAIAQRALGTVGDLLDDWLAALAAETDPAYRVAAASLRTYTRAARAIKFKPESREASYARRTAERAAGHTGKTPAPRAAELFALTPIGAVDKIALHDFATYLRRARGAHMARLAIAAFSAAYSWGGLDRRWRLGANPRRELALPAPPGRIVTYTDGEIRALVDAADTLGRPSIGDAVLLGLYTGQRQADRIAMLDEGLVDGRHHFRQQKTGKLVAIRPTAQLAERLAAARIRNAALKLRLGTRPTTVLVNELTGREYTNSTYAYAFRNVRAAAAVAMPSLAGKKDLDLRDTAISWLARAGCTMTEIVAISGHSAKSVELVMKHYLEVSPDMADAGIDKLAAWIKREGMKV